MEYLKSITPFVAGVILVVLGHLLDDSLLSNLGYGAIGGSGLTLVVPNLKGGKNVRS